MSTVIKNRLPEFSVKAKFNAQLALKEGARDILIKAKTRAPFEKGGLRRDSEVKMQNTNTWRVSFWSEYARYQEFGGDGKRTVRNYTTSGTSKHYLRDSGDEVSKTMSLRFRKLGVIK